jgi:hypothetical protein
MEAVLCKICKTRHYGPCVGLIRTSEPTPAQVPEPAPLPVPKAEDKPKTGFDRNAYQCQYMRERRKAQVPVHAIYAIVQHNEPDVVKIGQTKRWSGRRTSFTGSKSYTVYFIDMPVNLLMIERACLLSMEVPPCRGKEWFSSSIEHACSVIEFILNTLKLPYKVEKGSYQKPEKDNTGPFDRNAYQCEYMQKVRQKPF